MVPLPWSSLVDKQVCYTGQCLEDAKNAVHVWTLDVYSVSAMKNPVVLCTEFQR